MQHVRVLEIGTFWAAPLVGQHLANLGCQVTSLVRPDHVPSARRERSRLGPSRDALRAGKRIVPLALPEQLAEALALVRDADVLVENFATGTLDALGLSYEVCKACNPRLLYVSLPGFAPADPEFENVKAYESVILAAAGVFRDMGLNRTLLGVPASYTHLPLASAYTSMHASYAILAALCGGCGISRHVVLPLASCLAETMVHNSMHLKVDRCYMNARQRRIEDGDFPIPAAQLETLFDPFFKTYECADGSKFYLVCPSHRKHQCDALRILGIENHGVPTVDPYSATGEKGLGSGSLSDVQACGLRPRMEEAFRRFTAKEWERRFGRAGVPGAAHRTTDEWRREATHLVDADGKLAPPAWLDASHTLDAPLPLPANTSLPLAGVVVLDLCNVIAGPTIGHLLARMGADVVKVDPLRPTYAPEVAVLYGLAVNRGKRSILLDVHKDRHAFERLLRKADVLLVNCTQPALERMRLTAEDVRAVNPRCVLARFDAWSGPYGPHHMEYYNGYDDCVQAAIGIMWRFGGGSPEEHAHIGTIDVVAGVAGAMAVAAALYERSQTGVVHVARASLAAVGQYLQYPFYYGSRWSVGRGVSCIGEHRGLRFFQVRDGVWILVVLPFDGTRRPLPALSEMQAYEACRAVRAAGGEAVRLRSLRHVRDTYRTRPSPTFAFDVFHDHPVGTLVLVRPNALRGLPVTHLDHAPHYGAHTRDVVGYDVPRWNPRYLPHVAECDRCGPRGSRRFELPCTHFVCRPCAALLTCPVCSCVHDGVGFDEWRTYYARWRRGEARGARGEPWQARTTTGMRRVHSVA